MTIKISLPDQKRKTGIIESYGLIVPDDLDDLPTLVEEMRKQNPAKYRDAMPFEVIQAIGRGELNHVKPIDHSYGKNQILQSYFDKEFAYNMGTLTNTQELAFKYFAVGTRYTRQPDPITKLGYELARVVPTYIQPDGSSNIYTSSYFNKTTANPTGNTTVVSATSNTITLTSATGFAGAPNFGNRICIQTANAIYFATTINLVGSTITVNDIQGGNIDPNDNANFLPNDIPQAGNFVSVTHCEAGLFMGPLASGTQDTGTPANWKAYQFRKVRPPAPNGVSSIYNVIFLNLALP